jgi:hypothetical protein
LGKEDMRTKRKEERKQEKSPVRVLLPKRLKASGFRELKMGKSGEDKTILLQLKVQFERGVPSESLLPDLKVWIRDFQKNKTP